MPTDESINFATSWPSWPIYGDDEKEAVSRVISSNQLFAASEVRAFEESYAKYVSCRFAIGVGNATQGLHLSLAALGVGQGHEVIVTPYSWISSASCILMQNAVPIFCDIEEDTLGIDPKKLEGCISSRTRAVILVHMSGYPARVHEIKDICDRYKINLIEDASHAHGAKARGVNVGTIGRIGVLSMHQRKALPVGDGGIILTQDKAIYEKIYRLRSFGDEELSYNYRMSEFAAAIGLVRLTKLDQENGARRHNFKIISDELKGCKTLDLIKPHDDDYAVHYSVLLRTHTDDVDSRVSLLQAEGIPIKKTWGPLHKHPHFNPITSPARGEPWNSGDYFGVMRNARYASLNLPVADSLCPHRILELPVHPPLGEHELRQAVRKIISEFEYL